MTIHSMQYTHAPDMSLNLAAESVTRQLAYFWLFNGDGEIDDWTTSGENIDSGVRRPSALSLTNGQVDIVQLNEFRFNRLLGSWRQERGATSSITAMAMCPSYQKIIAIGPAVIPLILRQLEREGDNPDMWFWALRVLTDVDPIPEDLRGDVVAMSRAWLSWAQDHYVW